jgi:predicted acyltransferase
MIQAIVVGAGSSLCLLVFVLAVNLIARYVREVPLTEYDRAVLKLTAVFVAYELLGFAWVGR